jgi:nitric oxide reductase subunit B
VLQLLDVLKNGYWHARSQAYMGQPLVKTIEWIRMGPDLIFVLAGCIPLAIAVLFTLWQVIKHKKSADANH